MRLTHTTSQDNLIWHWRSGGFSQCGWLRLCTTVAMGMTITDCWGFFPRMVKKEHYDKLIGIRELLEQLAKYCFNNHFSPDRGTPWNNIPPLDEVYDVDAVSTCHALNFSSCISPSIVFSTISGMSLSSASSISIGYQHMIKKEEAKQGGRYNRLTKGYCSGKLHNGNRCLHRSLYFCKVCNRFNKKV